MASSMGGPAIDWQFRLATSQCVHDRRHTRLPAFPAAWHIGHGSAFRNDRRQRVLAVAPPLPAAATRAPVRMGDRWLSRILRFS